MGPASITSALPQCSNVIAAWLHTLDPFAIQLTDTFGIRWYGLSYLLGFLAGYLIIRRVCKTGISTLPPEKVSDLIVTLALGVVIGGRLGYVFFYQPSLLWQFENTMPFWGVFAINQGGMASHGGILGCIAATAWFGWKHKQPWPHLLDLMAFGAPLGLMFGRLANFINGELYGRACDPDFALAVQFPQEVFTDPELEYKLTVAYGRQLPPDWLALLQSGHESLQTAALQVIPYRHPSQLYAAALEGLLVMVVLIVVWWKPRRSLSVAGAFCITYAVARFIDEFFRLPDEHLGLQALGLTRGQWLSFPVLITGIAIIAWSYSKKLPVMGGWRKSKKTEN